MSNFRTLEFSFDCPAGYTISWSSSIATYGGGYLSINKNSSNVVYTGGSTSGTFTANNGDTIDVYMNGVGFSSFQVDAWIYVDATLQQSGSGPGSVTISHSFTVSGNHTIEGIASDGF